MRGIQPDIVIYGEDAGGWRPTYGILETAFHELGHCAFFYRVNGRNAYKGYVDTIRESWSNLIGWAVTENEYTLRGYAHEVHKYETFFQPPMYHMLFEVPDEYNFQSWSKYSINTDYGREYTPIFIDIYDGSNQRASRSSLTHCWHRSHRSQTMPATMRKRSLMHRRRQRRMSALMPRSASGSTCSKRASSIRRR